MPKGWIDKKTANTYHVVHRSHEDPLANDSDAPQQVLVKVENLNTKEKKIERRDKWKIPIYTGERLAQEAEEFAKQGRRENEGEAALYGINYDDSNYDYMQHLKPIGTDSSAVFIARKDIAKGKQTSKKGGALMLNSDYMAANHVKLPSEVLPSEELVKRSYQDQQNIPDEISGFQPDMDENLREVLEALDDEEYVDNDEEFFTQIVSSGKKLNETEEDWDNFEYDENIADEYISDGSDHTIKENGPRLGFKKTIVQPKEGEAEWETAFRQFKIDQQESKAKAYDSSEDELDSDLESERADQVGSLADTSITRNGRGIVGNKKKRKNKIGVKTDLTGFSMSSSALFRNEGLSLLDDRFDRLEQAYNDDDEEEEEEEEENHQPFDMSKERDDLEAIMDDFLDNYVVEGKKMYKR